MPIGHYGTSRYECLTQALLALSPEQGQVHHALAELETLIGVPLLASAGSTVFWTSSNTALRQWRLAGWYAHLHHGQWTVTFMREPV